MDQFLGSCKRSAHEVGLLDLLDISCLTESIASKNVRWLAFNLMLLIGAIA